MGRSVRISEEHARTFARMADGVDVPTPDETSARETLKDSLARLDRVPKGKPRKKRDYVHLTYHEGLAVERAAQSRKPSKEEKRKRRAGYRDIVFERAEDQCEGPTDSNPTSRSRCGEPATDFAHIFGRGAGRFPESERSTAALCRTCHRTCGHNFPSGCAWWEYWAWWFQDHGFMREAAEAAKRAGFVQARSALPAAPRIR